MPEIAPETDMTPLDWFAAFALAGLLASPKLKADAFADIAEDAFAAAKAMIRARSAS